jgi:hypothetical protein
MSHAGHFDYNYPRVIKFLKENDVDYHEFANGQHLRVLAPSKIVDVWPSRMTYHIVTSEDVIFKSKDEGYKRLNFWFDEAEFEKLIFEEA